MSRILVGESLIGDGNEIAHIDLLIGEKDGPVGAAFCNALVNQNAGHTALLAVLAPNLLAKPATIIQNKVTIKGAGQAILMFGPAQAAVGKAVADCVADGIIPRAEAENLVCIVSIFIHWDAKDKDKIYKYNHQATKEAIARAMKSEPSVEEVLKGKEEARAKHPYA
ncbi:MAG: formaldehyde-activating enzyme [Acidobacteriota bacterium]